MLQVGDSIIRGGSSTTPRSCVARLRL
jgi:hypothetical protein